MAVCSAAAGSAAQLATEEPDGQTNITDADEQLVTSPDDNIDLEPSGSDGEDEAIPSGSQRPSWTRWKTTSKTALSPES